MVLDTIYAERIILYIYLYPSDYYHLTDLSGLLKAIIDTLETVQRPVFNSLSFAQN